MRNVNWKRRNWCAAGTFVFYALVIAIANGFYHFASPIQVDRNQGVVFELILGLSLLQTVLYFATSFFWARAKNWPGYVGTVAALGGSILWLCCALAVVAPYFAKLEMNEGNPSFPLPNWLPILPWVAFTFTSVVLKLIPVRKTGAGAVPDAA